jgi:hypothetical protein
VGAAGGVAAAAVNAAFAVVREISSGACATRERQGPFDILETIPLEAA